VCSSIFQVLFKIGPVVLPLWVVENRPSPLLWPLAYTTACTTVQAVISVTVKHFCQHCYAVAVGVKE